MLIFVELDSSNFSANSSYYFFYLSSPLIPFIPKFSFLIQYYFRSQSCIIDWINHIYTCCQIAAAAAGIVVWRWIYPATNVLSFILCIEAYNFVFIFCNKFFTGLGVYLVSIMIFSCMCCGSYCRCLASKKNGCAWWLGEGGLRRVWHMTTTEWRGRGRTATVGIISLPTSQGWVMMRDRIHNSTLYLFSVCSITEIIISPDCSIFLNSDL